MIIYFTGLPGAGKTLNLIKEVLTDPNYKGRPVYYYGIEECTVDDWNEIDQPQLNKWYELPEGSVILIDEVQRPWRVRSKSSAVPKHIEMLETHRHLGIDFLVTSQFPRQTDTFFRGLVGRHYHFERQFGFNTLRRFEFQKCIADPVGDYFARQEAIKTTQKLDSKYFGLYKSAEVHTHKKRVPKKLITLGLISLLVAAVAISIPSILSSKPSVVASDAISVNSISDNIKSPLKSIKDQKIDVDYGLLQDQSFYLKSLTPIVQNKPDTAPIYAALHVPVSKPRPNCISYFNKNRLRCQCYSQQATKLKIDHKTCIYYVNNGYDFDYTRPDVNLKEREVEEGDSPPPALNQVSSIPQTQNPNYPSTRNSYAGIR